MTAASAPPGGSEYERIVEQLVQQLQSRVGVTTERVSRDVRVPGKATVNQIDVLWDLVDAAGQAHRVVFEARSYRNRIKQSALHAFRSVVDDIQEQSRPVTGVMVTTTGYQSGAADVASTYGVIILELRAPTREDLRNRVTQIQVDVTMQHIVVEALDVEAIEIYDGDSFHFGGTLDSLSVKRPGEEVAQSLESLLLTGEVGTLTDPRPVHSVRRDLDPPADLLVKGQPRALIRAITADVGVRKTPPVALTIRGLESVAWMLRDAITGARAWIAQDGRVWSTPS